MSLGQRYAAYLDECGCNGWVAVSFDEWMDDEGYDDVPMSVVHALLA